MASDMVAKSEPDGTTMLLMSNGSAGLFKNLPYHTAKDFAPVSTLGFFDIAIVTRADSLFKTLPELLHAEIKRWGEVITRANIPRQ